MRYLLLLFSLSIFNNCPTKSNMTILQVKTKEVFLNGGMGGHIVYEVESVTQGQFDKKTFRLGFWNYEPELFHYKTAELRLKELTIDSTGNPILFFPKYNLFGKGEDKYTERDIIFPKNTSKKDFPNLQEISPVEFVEYLKNEELLCLVIKDIPKNWVKKEHVEYLKMLVNSKEKCLRVFENNGYGKGELSTIGKEVSILLDSYKTGKYEPRNRN